MLNAVTVDLEDWGQSVLDPAHPITDRVVENTMRVLDLLDHHSLKATFFALGKVCERFPSLLPRIASAGHEIGSHGFGHELVHTLTPERFAEDVRRSVEIIEAQIGRSPEGYRAPAFSVTRNTLWAGPILKELGFRYSSSVFPFRGRRYGIPDAPRTPHHWPNCTLIEFPLTTFSVANWRFPAMGGGYTRLFPGPVTEWMLGRLNHQGIPGVLYLHPYELAPDELQFFLRQGITFSRSKYLTQCLGRRRVPGRLETLFSRFPFGSMNAALADYRLSQQSSPTPDIAPALIPGATE